MWEWKCKTMCMCAIEIAESALRELDRLRAAGKKRVVDALETQLSHQPESETRRRKVLVGLDPPFDTVPPLWQLSVGSFRVFYDVSEEEGRAYVRAVRHKPAHKTTEEIL